MNRLCLLAIFLAGCGPVTGAGTLGEPGRVTAVVGTPTEIPFEVWLYCGRFEQMKEIQSATATILEPDGGVVAAPATWKTREWHGYDCGGGNEFFAYVASITVAFTPPAEGIYLASIKVEPGVGTFSRPVDVIAGP